MCERGIFRLSFIRVNGELAAGTIGFVFEGTYSLYNSAFDRGWQRLAPGMVLVAEDMREAIDDGCAVFDFLKGDYAYKYRFGAGRRIGEAARRLPLGGRSPAVASVEPSGARIVSPVMESMLRSVTHQTAASPSPSNSIGPGSQVVPSERDTRRDPSPIRWGVRTKTTTNDWSLLDS